MEAVSFFGQSLLLVVILLTMATSHGPTQLTTFNNTVPGLFCVQWSIHDLPLLVGQDNEGQVATGQWFPSCTCEKWIKCKTELEILLSSPPDGSAPVLVIFDGCMVDLIMVLLSEYRRSIFLYSPQPVHAGHNVSSTMARSLFLNLEEVSLMVSLPGSLVSHLCPMHVEQREGCLADPRWCPVKHHQGHLYHPPPLWLLGNNSIYTQDTYVMTWETGDALRGKHLIITTIEWWPFVIRHVENDTIFYTGLCYDLLAELASELGFSYTLVEPTEPSIFGVNVDGNWTGVVGQVARREVDLLVGPITIDPNRDKVVDFTVAIYFDYTSILFRTPNPSERKYRILIDPFRGSVWLGLIGSIPFMAVAMFLLTWISDWIRSASRPGHTVVHVPCRENKQVITSRRKSTRFPALYWWEACWIVYGSGFSQSCVCPWMPSARVVFWSWLAFIIIMSSTYTGNLVATLTVPLVWEPFTSLDELVTTSFKWGTVGGTFFHDLFEESTTMPYSAVWDGIERVRGSDPAVLSDNLTQHIEKVLEGNYAFIYEKSTLKTPAMTCGMMLAREDFLPTQLAFALQEGSPYTHAISNSILKMRENGLFRRWERIYWPDGSKCITQKLKTEAVSLDEIQGAFYVLATGIVAAIFCGCGEIVSKRYTLWITSQKQTNIADSDVQATGQHNRAYSTIRPTKAFSFESNRSGIRFRSADNNVMT